MFNATELIPGKFYIYCVDSIQSNFLFMFLSLDLIEASKFCHIHFFGKDALDKVLCIKNLACFKLIEDSR